MIIFCVITCMMADWVKSKPPLGLVGVTSAVMGTVTAFGFCMYVGVPFIGINLAAPFLMLGIGIDDTFVTLAAWRRTSMHQVRVTGRVDLFLRFFLGVCHSNTPHQGGFYSRKHCYTL